MQTWAVILIRVLWAYWELWAILAGVVLEAVILTALQFRKAKRGRGDVGTNR